MQTLTATVEAFAFDELSNEGKENARRVKREALYELGWMSDDIDWAVRRAALEMLTPDLAPELDGTASAWAATFARFEVLWNLSHCQGDGVSFDGTLYRMDAPGLPWPTVRTDAGRFGTVRCARLRNSGWQTNEYAFTVELTDEDGTEHRAPEAFVEALRDVCRAAERAGYAADEAATSDEAIDEMLRDEGEAFDKYGCHVPAPFHRDGRW